ncbi:response regulator [uncultured Fusobacterium sp.]|jgi:two-component system KDP operon response regulator KdpE|uniref:response regulator n=1 Tax=uncultured Fusobacterium sp. TaxID=159267 RepID=UPI0015A55DCC|nr:response regulator transcription factor [uncultured Fusobacterium sp.]
MFDKKILIIEDEKVIQNFLSLSLKSKKYEPIIAENGLLGISLFMSHNPDLILLDLGLPDIDGTEVLKQIRSSSDIPIIIISARGQEREKVNALDLGADDYITKPFNIEELFARIRVVLRRYKPQDVRTNDFKLGGLLVNFEKRKVYINDEEIHLTPIEYKMLVLLIQNQGKVLTHRFIQQEIWGSPTTDDYQSLRVFMSNIRRKIETDTSEPKFIKTEVGVGYRLVEE